MSREVPTKEPRSLIAGATAKWTRSFEDYPASEGWTLKYFLRGVGDPLDITCSVDPDDANGFLAVITATQSATLEPVTYTLQGQVSKSGEKYIVIQQEIVILPNLEAATNNLDSRTIEEQILAALTAGINTSAGSQVVKYTIGDRSIEKSREEAIRLHSYYSRIVADQKRRKRVAKGGEFFDSIQSEFR